MLSPGSLPSSLRLEGMRFSGSCTHSTCAPVTQEHVTPFIRPECLVDRGHLRDLLWKLPEHPAGRWHVGPDSSASPRTLPLLQAPLFQE